MKEKAHRQQIELKILTHTAADGLLSSLVKTDGYEFCG